MKNKIIQIFFSLIIFLIALFFHFDNIFINHILYFISYIIVGFGVIKEAIENIFKGKFLDENSLMTIATIGAFAIGEFPEAIAVMLLYQIGETMQDYAVNKSKKSITELMDIRPDFANIKQNNEIIKVDPNEVNIGDTILVKPGEKIPLDGKIINGCSLLDTSSLTGESVPREVTIGDNVISGCINKTSLIELCVTKNFGESTVSKILDLVENASNKKSKSENFITKFAKYYTPIVVLIALIIIIFPPLLLNDGNFYTWIYRALTFLVVSCPCALVISIPLGFFAGIGGASKEGILIKGSNYLEYLSKAEIAVFDKTGTLTEGIFEVQEINPIGISKSELLEIATYAENYSNHPISLSLKKAYNKEIDSELISNVEELPGLGISCTVNGKNVLIGNDKLMEKHKIDYVKSGEIGTILYVSLDKKYVGNILISDKVKKDAYNTIKNLKENNIKKTIMLTGDRKSVGEAVAHKLNIDEVYTDLLPTDKAEKLEQIIKTKTKNGKVIFVGDGINDSPVLALSDIGIAMGALGSDSAIEAADIVIMTDELSKIVSSIKLSKRTLKIVKQNIIFSIFVKLIILCLSAFGISTMWEAVFADVGVSIIAILNSLRALKIK